MNASSAPAQRLGHSAPGVAAAAPATTGASVAAAAASAIPFKSSVSTESQGIGLPAALLICLLLLAVAVVLLRRGKLPMLRTVQPLRRLQVLESRTLGDRVRVSVLRYRDRELLVAHSEQVVTVLSDTAAEPTGGERT